MRISRTLSIGTGIAIVAVSALLVTSSAIAAPEAGVIFVVADDFNPLPVPGSPYAPTWTESNEGELSSGLSGLTVNSYANLANQFSPAIYAGTGSALRDFAATVDFGDSNLAEANAAIYYSVDGDETVLTSDLPIGNKSWNQSDLLWNASISINGLFTGTLSDFDAAMATNAPNGSIYAAGVNGDYSGEGSSTLTMFALNGTKYLFTPEPVYTPNTVVELTPSQLSTTGYTLSTTGFLPSEEGVEVYVSGPGELGGNLDGATVNDQGAIVGYNYKLPVAEALAGAYRLTFVSSNGVRLQTFDFEVVDELAATGAEPMGLIATAGAFGLVGAGVLAAIAIRRKKATHA